LEGRSDRRSDLAHFGWANPHERIDRADLGSILRSAGAIVIARPIARIDAICCWQGARMRRNHSPLSSQRDKALAARESNDMSLHFLNSSLLSTRLQFDGAVRA